MKIVYIKWRDAQADNEGYYREDQLQYHWHPYTLETVGHLLESPLEDEVVVAVDRINGDNRYRNLQGIPKAYIIEMYELIKHEDIE